MLNLVYYILGLISGVGIKLLVDKYVLYEKNYDLREKKFDDWFTQVKAMEEKKKLDN